MPLNGKSRQLLACNRLTTSAARTLGRTGSPPASTIERVEILGDAQPMKFDRSEDALQIALPTLPSEVSAIAFKITGRGLQAEARIP